MQERVVKSRWAVAQQAARLECERECERAVLSLLSLLQDGLGAPGLVCKPLSGVSFAQGF